MTITKRYAIGAVEDTYTQGVFKDYKTAASQTARAGEFLWRLEDTGSGPVKAVKIRRWNQSEGEWEKLIDMSDGPADPLTEFHRNLRGSVDSQGKQRGEFAEFHKASKGRDIVKDEPKEIEYTNDVDIAYFERGLKINRNELDTQIPEQPSLFQQVGDRYSIAVSLRDAAKDELRQIEGKLYTQIRHEVEGRGEKITDSGLTARINSHPERIKAFNKYNDLTREANRWENMRDSYKDRGYMLKTMADLWASGYWSNNSAHGAERVNQNAEYDRNQEIRRNAYRDRK